MAQLLENEGFEVHAAVLVSQAIAKLDQDLDLIIVDLNLPDGDGHQVIASAAALPRHVHTPIVCVTASKDESDVETAFAAGACDYMLKPIWVKVLREKIKYLIGKKQITEQLEVYSIRDPLTGLLNRRGFEQQLEDLWGLAKRKKLSVSALFIDLDNFKMINDRYGHDVGDICLNAVSSILMRYARRSFDLVSRIGGDEFVLILPDTDASSALTLGESICQSVWENPISVDTPDMAFNFSVTIGIATQVPCTDSNCSALVQRADKQLLFSKRLGRKGTASVEVISQHTPSHVSEDRDHD